MKSYIYKSGQGCTASDFVKAELGISSMQVETLFLLNL